MTLHKQLAAALAQSKQTASAHEEAMELYDLAAATFKRLGWKVDRRVQSAITTCVFTPKGDLRGESYSFGWHLPGTQQARRYGITEARFLSLHHTDGDGGPMTLIAEGDILDKSGKSDSAAIAKATALLKGLR